MVARTRPESRGFIVEFLRDGDPTEAHFASNGIAAATRAMAMIAQRRELRDGDMVLVRLDLNWTDMLEQDLPEVSRSSHHSG